MNEAQFKERTKKVALRVIRLVDSLPRKRSADVIGRQLLRSATSVGANYRAACRAKSRKDMIAKPGIVEEEADESLCWLELIIESAMMRKGLLTPLLNEMNQILAMVVASQKTMRRATQSKIQNRHEVVASQKTLRRAPNPKSKI
jgi:four helix bundle protein